MPTATSLGQAITTATGVYGLGLLLNPSC